MGSQFNNFWQKPAAPSAEEETAAELAANEKVPSHRIFFRGRSMLITVTILSFSRDPEQLDGFGAIEIGKTIQELLAHKDFVSHLRRQSIVTKEAELLVPKIALPFGDLTLYAAASSHNHSMAMRMAIDRLALSLLNSRSESKPCAEIMAKHFVTVSVNA